MPKTSPISRDAVARRAISETLGVAGRLMSDENHRWKADPVKWDACGRLEEMGATIGSTDENKLHVEFRRHLNGTPIQDSDIPGIVADVNTLEDTTTLDLSECAISDQSTVHLGELRTVTALYLGRTKLTDASIPNLVAIPTLRELVLSGTGITDVGLLSLADAKRLQFVQLYATMVTAAGVARLKQALPELFVESRVLC